jgi:hypothetical protein
VVGFVNHQHVKLGVLIQSLREARNAGDLHQCVSVDQVATIPGGDDPVLDAELLEVAMQLIDELPAVHQETHALHPRDQPRQHRSPV